MKLLTLKILILIVLLTPEVCWAQRSGEDQERKTRLDGVLSNTELTEPQRAEQKENLRGLIHKDVTPSRNDYVDDFARGTVDFNPEKGNRFGEDVLKVRNYSFHTVIIPDGTTIEGVNFSQAQPHTAAIIGKNLTFVECNLNNVEIDPTWTLIRSLAIHSRKRIVRENGTEFKVHEVEKNGVFEEVSREEIPADDR